MRRLQIMLVAAVTLIMLSSIAFAERPEANRGGFFIGFGAGGGVARPDSDVDYEGGGAGNFRVGYAFSNEFVLGLESFAWVSEIEGVDWTFNVVGPGVTFYPGNTGFFAKGVVGYASIEASVGNFSVSEGGFGITVGGGYEIRLTTKFAMGLEADYSYMNLGEDLTSGSIIDGLLTFNWYWSDAQ